MIARQAGYNVSGSDKQDSQYIHYLQEHGVTTVHIGQSYEAIAAIHERQPIDWYVYSSAVLMEQPDAPEFRFCQQHNIPTTTRNELINKILADKQLKMLAIAGTHGKTTTTAMAIWVFKQLGIPISYSVGGKLSFGEMGEYAEGSQYFVYEADEFARNFLAFHPALSLISGVDWDHPDIYPTREEYYDAFRTFIGQSQKTVLWATDNERLGLAPDESRIVLPDSDEQIDRQVQLPGRVNRLDAWIVAQAISSITQEPVDRLCNLLSEFPGVSRRFERITHNLFSDYAHTPAKIRGALQIAHEAAGPNVVVVYEGLHNTRQHFIKDELTTLFDDIKQLYIVPSYLAREDESLPLLSPTDLRNLLSESTRAKAKPAALDDDLKQAIQSHLSSGDLVLCLTAGGGHSLDEWLRTSFPR